MKLKIALLSHWYMPCQGSVTTLNVRDKWYDDWNIRGLSNLFNDRRKLNAIINTSELVNLTNVKLSKRGVWVKDNSEIFNKLLFIFSILHK